MNFPKAVLIFCVASIIMIMATSQKPQTPTHIRSVNDSTISLKELSTFNVWLKDNASVTQYQNLTPETTLQWLWRWKLDQIAASKKVTDSTKKK